MIIDPFHLVHEIGASSHWAVVEFKTDFNRDAADRERILAETDYPAQIARYRQAIETLLGQTPAVYLCWLNVVGGVVVEER